MTEFEIYVHIPFCVRKCAYCDFYSAPAAEEIRRAYVDTVIREIGETPFGHGDNECVRSVFFGGGTPSILPGEDIARILEAIRSAFRVKEDAEISVECNPGTLDAEKLAKYRAAGVNRLSLGLQSADNEILKRIGRIHTFDTFLESYEAAREAGFRNLNVDLITGLPGDTPENFEKGLKTVLSLRPEHLSVYSLILEENTPFYASYEAGTLSLPAEEEERAMYALARTCLRAAGYRQYEISNFALPGFSCLHNEGYWTQVPYLGFGSAAASFYENKRFRNAAALNYMDLPYEETETLSAEDLKNEFVMLGLRMTDGISLDGFRRRFGESLERFKGGPVRRLIEEGLLEKRGGDNETRLALTERGLDLANVVFREFV